MSFIDIEVNASDALGMLAEVEGVPEAAGRSTAAYLRRISRYILELALTQAFSEAGNVPTPYQAHLRRSLSELYPSIRFDGSSISVLIKDPVDLGDENDLEEAYHYHAIEYTEDFDIHNPIRVDLPGPDQELYAYRPPVNRGDRREEYWQALERGDTTFDIYLGRAGIPRTVPIPTNALEATYSAHVRQWADRYPEWMMLEFGWPHSPALKPGRFSEHLEEMFEREAEIKYEEIAEKLLAQIERSGARISGGFLRGGRAVGNSGQFAPYLNVVSLIDEEG